MKLRTFILRIGCLTIAATIVSSVFAAPVGTGKSFKGPVGLQLYSLREQFKKDVPGTLDEVKGFGIKYAELAGTYNLSPENFRAELEKRGIEPVSGHFGFEKYRDDLPNVVREAKALGLKVLGLRLDSSSG